MSARKADILGHILVCTRYNSYRLLSVETNDQWHYYAALLDYFNNILKKKTFPFGEEESALPSRCTGFTRAQHRWSNSTNFAPNCFPSIFARFSILRLFPVSKKMIRRKEIHHQRAAHRRNRGLFWKIGQIILFGRLEKVGESLNQIYRAKRRLC